MPCHASYYLDAGGNLRQNLTEAEIKGCLEAGEGLLWVDISETTEEDGRFLDGVFRFHPLAVEDCVSTNIHPPKVDDFGGYLFIVVHGVNYAVESEFVETAELAIFLGGNYVVTNHNYPLFGIEAVRSLVEQDARPMRHGADRLAHTIIDTFIDNVMPTVDRMTEIVGEIEEHVIHQPRQETLEAILRLKRSASHLHRVMAPQREVLNRISRGDYGVIGQEARIFYRDVYDHIVRIEDLNQMVRDMTDNALSTYLSSVANRQNEVMKVLSVVAAIFLPLTLLVGIYGMNFQNMPELGLPWGYYAVLGFIVMVILVVVWIFWARGWISWGRRRVAIKSLKIDRQKLLGYARYLRRRQNGRHHG